MKIAIKLLTDEIERKNILLEAETEAVYIAVISEEIKTLRDAGRALARIDSLKQTIRITGEDIGKIEMLHDALLEEGIFGLNARIIRNSRALILKLRNHIT